MIGIVLRMINGGTAPTAPIGETLGQRNAAAATAVNNTNTVIAYLKGLMNRFGTRLSVNVLIQRRTNNTGTTTSGVMAWQLPTPVPLSRTIISYNSVNSNLHPTITPRVNNQNMITHIDGANLGNLMRSEYEVVTFM